VRRPLPLAAAILTVLAAALPAGAGERLDTIPFRCDGVVVRGTGFPEHLALLLVRDVDGGKVLAGPVEVATGGDGAFRARLRVDLSGRPGVEVSAWRQQGTTATMTARELVGSPCMAGTSRSRAAYGTLPRSGGSAPAMVSLGLGLIAVGAVARHAGRRPPGRPRGGAHLAARATRGRHERT
jgi:hypothetical protein